MIISFIVAIYFQMLYTGDLLDHEKLVIGVAITTVGWILVTLLTKPEEDAVLRKFYTQVKPHKGGWNPWLKKMPGLDHSVSPGGGLLPELGAMILGCLMVYGFLFGLGYWIYGELGLAAVYFSVGVISGWILKRMWGKLSFA